MNLCTQNIPFIEAAKVWKKHCEHISFGDLIQWCTVYGFTYSFKDVFLLARPWTDGADMYERTENPDTWLLIVAASDGKSAMRRFFELAPYPLSKVAFYRGERFVIKSWDYLKGKVYGQRR